MVPAPPFGRVSIWPLTELDSVAFSMIQMPKGVHHSETLPFGLFFEGLRKRKTKRKTATLGVPTLNKTPILPEDTGERFSWILRSRPDLLWDPETKLPPLDQLAPTGIYAPRLADGLQDMEKSFV